MIRWWAPRWAILFSLLVLFVYIFLMTRPKKFETAEVEEAWPNSSKDDGPALAEDEQFWQFPFQQEVTLNSSDKRFTNTKIGGKPPTLNAIYNCKATKDPIILLVDNGELLHDTRMEPLRSWRDCPHKCCYTQDWDGFVDTADLVAFSTFSFPEIPLLSDLNQSSILEWQATNKNQIWLSVSTTSPYNHRQRGREIDGVFHMIANYRPDADIQFPYGTFENIDKKPAPTERFVHTWLHQHLFVVPPPPSYHRPKFEEPPKKKMAVWRAGRCQSGSRREFLIKSLQKYVQVEVYGDCGPFQYPSNINAYSFDYMAANYKFYLAFEDSLCIGYVTGRLWEPLSHQIVPITFSWINDTGAFPPNSYINALDFRSVKELAEYMIYLDANEDEYHKYFQWKDKYRVIEGGNGLCATCAKLLELRKSSKITAGTKFRRHGSFLGWMNTLPKITNNGDGNDGAVEFRIAKNKVSTNKTCIDPFDHKVLMDWIRDIEP